MSAGFVLAGALEETATPGGKPVRGRKPGVGVRVSVTGRVFCAWLCGWQVTGTCPDVRIADGKLAGGRFIPDPVPAAAAVVVAG